MKFTPINILVAMLWASPAVALMDPPRQLDLHQPQTHGYHTVKAQKSIDPQNPKQYRINLEISVPKINPNLVVNTYLGLYSPEDSGQVSPNHYVIRFPKELQTVQCYCSNEKKIKSICSFTVPIAALQNPKLVFTIDSQHKSLPQSANAVYFPLQQI
jgi:hypothetical protein